MIHGAAEGKARGKSRADAARPGPGSACPLPQAWLTEIHEYAQRDVVIMLLGNKVSGSGPRRPTLLPLPLH